jgi:hypothetical protein
MKILKTLCALTVLTSLFLATVPGEGICQMTQVQVSACVMPCCDKTNQAPSCPFIQPVVRPDFIAISSFDVTPVLNVIAILPTKDVLTLQTYTWTISLQPQIPKTAFWSTPQTLPAPPSLA